MAAGVKFSARDVGVLAGRLVCCPVVPSPVGVLAAEAVVWGCRVCCAGRSAPPGPPRALAELWEVSGCQRAVASSSGGSGDWCICCSGVPLAWVVLRSDFPPLTQALVPLAAALGSCV